MNALGRSLPFAPRRLPLRFVATAMLLVGCSDLTVDAGGQPAANGPERSRQISECTMLIEFARDNDALDRSAITSVARAAALAGVGEIVVTGEFAEGERRPVDRQRAARVRRELSRWGVAGTRVREEVGQRVPPAPGAVVRFCAPRTDPTEPNRRVRYRMPDGSLFAIPARYLPRIVWSDLPYEEVRAAPPTLTFAGSALEDQFSEAARRCQDRPGLPPDDVGCREVMRVSLLSQVDLDRRESNSWPPRGQYDETYFPLPSDVRPDPTARCTLRLGSPDDPMPDFFPGGSICVVSVIGVTGNTGIVIQVQVTTAEELVAKVAAVRRQVASFVEVAAEAAGTGRDSP